MALTEQLPVYRDVYRLILLIYRYTRNFPREYKYTLGQEMKRDAIMLVRSIYRANRSESKRQWLEEFLDNFEILKLEIRLCVDLSFRQRRIHGEHRGVFGLFHHEVGYVHAGDMPDADVFIQFGFHAVLFGQCMVGQRTGAHKLPLDGGLGYPSFHLGFIEIHLVQDVFEYLPVQEWEVLPAVARTEAGEDNDGYRNGLRLVEFEQGIGKVGIQGGGTGVEAPSQGDQDGRCAGNGMCQIDLAGSISLERMEVDVGWQGQS